MEEAIKFPTRSMTLSVRIGMTLHLFSVLGVILLVVGFVVTYWLAVAEDARMRGDFQTQARMVAVNFDPAALKKLSGTPADLNSPVYSKMKAELARYRAANHLYRFIYVAGMRGDGEVFFYLDSEPAESPDYSPPGQVYKEAGAEFREVFQTGREIVTGPSRDRWGNWVSALVPLFDPDSGQLAGLLGLDIDAGNWNFKIISRCAPALSLTILLGALLVFFFVLFRHDEKARQKIADSKIRLAESERAYRSVVMNMLDIFFRLDGNGVIIMLSPSAATTLGFSSVDELVGKNIAEFWADRRSLGALFETIARKGAVRDREIKLNHNSGKVLDFSVTVNSIVGDDGQPLAYEGIARDITERNRAKEQQEEMEKQVQRAQKMEAMATLAGGVAHDLNNILSGIVSYPDMILLQTAKDSPLRQPLEIIRDSGIKASVIVNDLLTLARRGVSVSEVVNINDLVVDYLRSPEYLTLVSFHPGVTVRTELADGLKYVLGSPVHLSKSLMNLVSNAAESMPDGGEIVITTRNRYLDHPMKLYERVQEGDYVVLSVSDKGVGVSREDQARIFEPFFSSKEMGRSGTGLGMAVIWGTVKDHQGYIDIKSEVGQGTTLKLYFPVTSRVPAGGEADFSMESISGHGEKILVIDDFREQREIASAILGQLGYSIKTVSSGEEAVEYLKSARADLLLLDMIMSPGMDGLETYRRILELHPGQRAIICSGYSETDRFRRAQKLGAGRYLKKPYTLEGLGVAVRDELRSPGKGTPGRPSSPTV